MGKSQINYCGLLRAPMSWAKIGRETIKGFLANGADVCVCERKGFNYEPGFELEPEIGANIKSRFEYDITLGFEYPLNYGRMGTKKKCGMLCYETTVLPEKWVDNINRHLDILFIPDEFNRKIFTDSGVCKDKIRIVPYGINPDYFYPREKASFCGGLFSFLCIAMPQKRKGVDVLIRAFEKVFGNDKETELVLKFPYIPGKSRYDIDAGVIKTVRETPNIKMITGNYTEKSMGVLYRTADCFVLPSRAEGFGLGYVESLACGTPVIAAGWGAHTCFLDETNSLLVDFKMKKAGEIQYDNFSPDALLAEPDFEDLCDKLKYMRENGDELKKQAKTFKCEDYYWNKITADMGKILAEI
ncbi:MAG TPA: glycosyltransferase [Firmicutes bacterium]|nr:glycosyltransferase [Bacillota bacterium]